MDPATIAIVVVSTIGAVGCRMLADWLDTDNNEDDDEPDEPEVAALKAKVDELSTMLEERERRDRSLLGEENTAHVPSSETGDGVDPWGTPEGADPRAPAPAGGRSGSSWWNDPQPPIQSIGGDDEALAEALDGQRIAARRAALAEEELRALRERFEREVGKSPKLYVSPRTEMIETFDGRMFPIVVGETIPRKQRPVVDHGAGLPPMSQPLKRPYLRTSAYQEGAHGKRKHQITFDLPGDEAIDDRPDQVGVELAAAASRTMNRRLLPGSLVRESQVGGKGMLRYTYGFYTIEK